MKCNYCGQKGIEIDCTGKICCVECWESMKNWTLEDQAKLEELAKEVGLQIRIAHKEIIQENGLPDNYRGILCHVCRKPVQYKEGDLYYCDCGSAGLMGE